MTILIAFLTFVLMLTSAFLILLVLVQLPKKEAGVGMAFGAGMSEMLLGAGSGNVLTRITKYTVGVFLGLSLVLSVLISGQARSKGLAVTQALEEKARSTPAATTPAPAPVNPAPLQSLVTSNSNAATTPLATTTTVVNPTAPTNN
ncbi:MAG: preprotein translocase subunit SecG [Verrucomicrobiales bacterium]|nr:preprotein translocase subunit SecG [Verrucomicrobiales bacterium]